MTPPQPPAAANLQSPSGHRCRSATSPVRGGFSRGLRPRKKRPPCQRGQAAPAAWGIPTGLTGLPIIPADGRESLRLACARHLPLTREASPAGFARAKRLPSQGSWPSLRGLRGFAAPPAAALSPNKKSPPSGCGSGWGLGVSVCVRRNHVPELRLRLRNPVPIYYRITAKKLCFSYEQFVNYRAAGPDAPAAPFFAVLLVLQCRFAV